MSTTTGDYTYRVQVRVPNGHMHTYEGAHVAGDSCLVITLNPGTTDERTPRGAFWQLVRAHSGEVQIRPHDCEEFPLPRVRIKKEGKILVLGPA